ncbi:MAG: N-methyl-L-tryptophan oxidase [Acidobacteria bacterium]|nr:N-methyl-L-tryptophan oxidase [Acidobacteriota bacterium]
MTSERFDVVIIGLGAMGSAAAYHLSRRGRRVLGLDQFTPPHSFGSSHGRSRIIREAYYEHPLYVPIVQRAYELWAELERDSGQTLWRQTGGLMIGSPEGRLVTGARRSAQNYSLTHEALSAEEIRRRFPALNPTDEMIGVWEPRAGILFPEKCIAAHLALAREQGTNLRFEEPTLSWTAEGAGVRVTTSKGSYQADRLILTAGAWLPSLASDLNLPLTIERQVLYWFEAADHLERFHPDRCPIYFFECEPDRFIYGFPDLGDGIKVARHHEGERTGPETVDQAVKPEEIETMRSLVRRFLPEADGALRETAVCLYTNTPDFHFLIDDHPHCPQALIASPCSGHGFKFASAIGEILADRIIEGGSRFDLSLFRLKRMGEVSSGQ